MLFLSVFCSSLTRPISPICPSPFFPYLASKFCFFLAVLHVYNVVEHGRRFLRTLQFTSDTGYSYGQPVDGRLSVLLKPVILLLFLFPSSTRVLPYVARPFLPQVKVESPCFSRSIGAPLGEWRRREPRFGGTVARHHPIARLEGGQPADVHPEALRTRTLARGPS